MNDNDRQINDPPMNRTIRLVVGVIDRTPGQNVGAKFIELKPHLEWNLTCVSGRTAIPTMRKL